MLLWVIYVLPGATTYLLLVRVLGRPWLALPGAFLALTLSGGSRSGVEEGLRWGLIAARLGWSLLPLLALSLRPWTERAKPPLAAALILASIILIHPAHAPAGLVLVFLSAAEGPGGLRARLAPAGLLTLAAGGLAAFWLVPLLAHLEMALPLAWGDSSLGALAGQIVTRPLLLGLCVASALACWLTRRGASPAARDRWLVRFAPALTAVIALDAVVIQPLGLHVASRGPPDGQPAARPDPRRLARARRGRAAASAVSRLGHRARRHRGLRPARLAGSVGADAEPLAAPRAQRVDPGGDAGGGCAARRPVGRAQQRAARAHLVRAVERPARVWPPPVVAAALPHHRAGTDPDRPRDRERHLHPSLAHRRAGLHGRRRTIGRSPSSSSSGTASPCSAGRSRRSPPRNSIAWPGASASRPSSPSTRTKGGSRSSTTTRPSLARRGWDRS